MCRDKVVGPAGILNLEVHAFSPDGQYTSQYILADITSGYNSTIKKLSSNQGGHNKSPDNGYIGLNGYTGLSDKQQCRRPDRLQISKITSYSAQSSKAGTGTLANTLDDNNLQTIWALKGTSVKAFVKSSSETIAASRTNGSSSSSDTNPWLQLDLGADKTVCNIGIAFPNGDETINFFKVQTSTDGKVFSDVGGVESYRFSQVDSYLRSQICQTKPGTSGFRT
jgi:hypothetical protein